MKRKQTETRRFFQFGGDFYAYSEKLFDLVALNVFFVLGSLPVVTMGASFSALYYAAVRSIRQSDGSVSHQFWRAWKRDLRQSLPVWLTVAGALFLLLLNVGILREKITGLTGLFFLIFYWVLLSLAVVTGCYAFPALSRFDMPAGWILKLALYMTFRYFPISLLLLALFALAYLLLLRWLLPLVFIIPAAFACVTSILIEPLLKRHSPKSDAEENWI